MKKYLIYFSFLVMWSCTCNNGDNSPKTTAYEVTFPDGRVKQYDVPGAKKPKKTNQKNSTKNVVSSNNAINEKSTIIPIEPKQAMVTKPVVRKPQPIISKIPSSCNLISADWMKKEFKADEDILINDASSIGSPTVRSCFYRWDNKILSNSGVFLQMTENPIPEEIDNYAGYFIQGKLETGEVDIVGSNYKYKPFDVNGAKGAYSEEQSKFFWKLGRERIMMIALNLGLSKKTELKHARNMATEIMKNYKE